MSTSRHLRKSIAVPIAFSLVAGLTWLGCAPDDASELTAPVDRILGQQQAISAAVVAQDRHTARLLSIPGVLGTGVGLDADGEATIRIYTLHGGVTGLPNKLDGVRVQPVVTGMIVARTAAQDPTSRFPRPVPIGVSTGHPDITAGTIGARVTDGTNVYALSNNHVYANSNDAQLGDAVIQPGTFDGGSSPADDIGTLFDYEPIDFSGGDNTIDAAIASTSTALVGVSTPSNGYGTPSPTTVAASVGLDVKKYGRTTGLTQGEVSEINVTVNVCYECAGPFCFNCKKLARFVDQIGITPGDFSGGGDSGSLIVTAGANQPCGLLFAGSSVRTLANPIDLVLTRFGVTIDDDESPPPDVTDIAVTGVSAPSSVVQGDVVSVDVTVANVGNQDVTDDITVTLTDAPPGGGTAGTVTNSPQTIVGGLAADESTTLNYSWDTNGASTGDHTLTASQEFADENSDNDSNSATVTVSEPSAGVSVTGIEPSSMQAGTTVDVTITGSGFAAGASVSLENGDGPAPSVSNVTFVDANTITATITAKAGGPPRNRVWDVRVTNPDGSSGVLADAFTITP